jgi:hypothetical protein
MSIHSLYSAHFIHSLATQSVSSEVPMPNAPSVQLPNGKSCIPQHYLQYQQTPQSIAALAADIHLDDHTLLFANADQHGMYLQVGLVGRENYERAHSIRPKKLVYGRKWRIDVDTPSSEVIQTAFLALKKAREHEVRELLTVQVSASGHVSAPFSSHIDLPLLAGNSDVFESKNEETGAPSHKHLVRFLEGVRFGQRAIHVEQVLLRPNGSILVDLRLGALPLARQAEGDLKEFNLLPFFVLLNTVSQSELLYELVAAMVSHSDRYVDERFTYQGFARFSRRNSPLQIAQLSIATRPYARDAGNAEFASVFKATNYAVDASRAPALGTGRLAEINRRAIAFHGPHLAGHMPQGYSTERASLSPAAGFGG